MNILVLVQQNELSFSSLKNSLHIESSGQLQHHLQKLSSLVLEKPDGSYALTNQGKRALEIYSESERTGSPLEELCCLPVKTTQAHNHQINSQGTILRLSLGLILVGLTAAIIASYLATGQIPLSIHPEASSTISFGPGAVILFGFFGPSFLIAAATGYPGCEVTAIPNLFTEKKMYCSCLMTPFNIPNGSLLKHQIRAQ